MVNWGTTVVRWLSLLSAWPEVMIVVSAVNLHRAKNRLKTGEFGADKLVEKWRNKLIAYILFFAGLLIVIVFAALIARS